MGRSLLIIPNAAWVSQSLLDLGIDIRDKYSQSLPPSAVSTARISSPLLQQKLTDPHAAATRKAWYGR